MIAVVIDIEDIRARRQTREALRQIRCETAREVARLHRETEARRARIEGHLNRIESDIGLKRPVFEVPA